MLLLIGELNRLFFGYTNIHLKIKVKSDIMTIKKRVEDYTSDCIPTGALRNAHNKIEIEKELIIENNEYAKINRNLFKSHNIYVVNLLSSPGAGKTSILEATLRDFDYGYNVYVIESDLQTDRDLEIIKSLGVDSMQINTDNGGYLDAEMIFESVRKMRIKDNSILFIENIGNLISPSFFDLGESLRVIVSSVTEGEDKPLKFPYMYETANMCLINKIDLLPHITTRLEILRKNIYAINSGILINEISALTGENIDVWRETLIQKVRKFK